MYSYKEFLRPFLHLSFYQQLLSHRKNCPSILLFAASLGLSVLRPQVAIAGPLASYAQVQPSKLESKAVNAGPQLKQDPSWREGSVQLLTITAQQGGHTSPVRAVTFHPNNRFFATGSADKSIRLWDLQGQSRVKVFSQNSEILSLAFSPDGRWLASGSLDGTVRIWDWQMGQLAHTFSGHEDVVTAIKFTADSRQLISGSGDKMLKVWRVNDGQNIARIETGQWIQSIALDPQRTGRIAIAGLGRQIEVWNWTTRRREQTSARLPSPIYAVDWHPSRQQLVLSPDSSNDSNRSGSRNSVALFDLESAQLGNSLGGHSDYVSFVAFSPSGDTLLSGSWDRTIRLWDTQTGELIRSFLENDRRILSGDFSSNGMAFVVGSGDGSIKVYRTQE
ncbi:MAG: WD40 repeat domain-containing protein [Cyanobacteria bacterium P01_C01_bin.69]